MEINATIFVTTISFIIFIFIMNAILYKPVMQIMEKRQKYIDDNQNAANDSRNKAKALLQDKDNKVADAQRKSRDIVAAKADAVKQERARVVSDAKQNAENYFSEQKQSLLQQKEESSKQMADDVADLANRLTTKLMGEGISFETADKNEVDEVMRKNV